MRTSLWGQHVLAEDIPAEDVPAGDVPAKDVPIKDMMSTQGLYVLAEDIPVKDVLGGDFLGKDIVSQQGHPSKDIVSSTDLDRRTSLTGTSLAGTSGPHRDVLDGDIYVHFYFCPFVIALSALGKPFSFT